MIVTFLVPSTKRTIGGVLALYEFANGLSRRGHQVHLVHLPFVEGHIDHLGDLSWFAFEPRIEHHLMNSFDAVRLPLADFIEVTALEFFSGTQLPSDLARRLPARAGKPFVFIQAYGIFTREVDHRVFAAPFPKLCIAHWLVDALLANEVPSNEVEYISQGLDHETFRLVSPIAGRPKQVAMLYNAHPIKGAALGLAAIEEVRKRIPTLRAVVFGNKDYAADIPSWIRFVQLPPRRQLVEEIYNGSRVFVCPAVREGFGLSSIEAMAGGCALVTADNGGSADYAIDGETALVCEPRDTIGMADRIEELLTDDARCAALAARGLEMVQRFSWDTSAQELEAFLERYALTAPGATRPSP